MTPMNWISVGIAAVFVVAYIVLKIIVKRKTDLYDGLGGIISKRKRQVKNPEFDEDSGENKEI